MAILGIDIGGTGIKGAPVDPDTGALAAERYRIPPPRPSRPAAVAETVAAIARHFEWRGPVGCTFPAVIKVDEYVGRLEALLWPDLFIIGGGASKAHARFLPLLHTRAEVVLARLLNDAGIIGAALAARPLGIEGVFGRGS